MLVSFKILLSDMGVTGNALVKKLNPAKKIILKASLRAYDILATSFQGLFSVMTLHRCFFAISPAWIILEEQFCSGVDMVNSNKLIK